MTSLNNAHVVAFRQRHNTNLEAHVVAWKLWMIELIATRLFAED